MNLTGNMPSVGASRFGLLSRPAVRVPLKHASVGASGCYVAPQAPDRQVIIGQTPGQVYLSATKKPLSVGQTVRGSNNTKNTKVDRDFRGTILEFIPPTAEGNNVRVRCNRTHKVFRVAASDIRSAV